MARDGGIDLRRRYVGRFFLLTLALVTLFAALAAFVPFRFANDRSTAKLTLLLENWGRQLSERARRFAQQVPTQETDRIGEATLGLPGGASVKIELAAVAGSRAVAARWLERDLKGLDPAGYLIDGDIPDRAIGDVVYIKGEPFLVSLRRIGAAVGVILGQSLKADFEQLQDSHWRLAVVRDDGIVFSGLPELSPGPPPRRCCCSHWEPGWAAKRPPRRNSPSTGSRR